MTPDDPRHGTYTGYSRGNCRCDLCKTAKRERSREWRAANRGRPAPLMTIINRPLPEDIRTYGISPSGFDYDAAIRAAAEFSVPRPQSPNRGTRR